MRVIPYSVLPAFLCVLGLLLSGAMSAEAGTGLNDAKYRQMLSASEELREADQTIRDTLEEARKTLSPEDYKEILKIQEYWTKNEFAANVKAYRATGLTEAQAWAMEIGSHADTLSQAVDVLELRRNGKGCEGVYEYNRSKSAQVDQGIMLVRRVDESYTVSIDVSKGKAGGPALCNYSGAGELQGNTLIVSVEDAPDASVTIVFSGHTAKVSASRAANNECENGVTLDGMFTK